MKRVLLIVFMSVCLLISVGCSEHTHKSGEFGYDSEYHWYKCAEQDCQEQLDKEAHNWDEGKISTVSGETVVTYTCKFCAAKRNEPYEPQITQSVTEEQWKNAFLSANFGNVTATISEQHSTTNTEYTIKANGSIVYLVIVGSDNGNETYYLGKYQEGYSLWTFTSREQTIEDSEFSIASADEIMSCENILKDYGLELGADFYSFTYNEQSQSYEAKNVGTQSFGIAYESVSVKLDNGKLSEIYAQSTNGSHQVKITFSGYGTTEPVPPVAEQ